MFLLLKYISPKWDIYYDFGDKVIIKSEDIQEVYNQEVKFGDDPEDKNTFRNINISKIILTRRELIVVKEPIEEIYDLLKNIKE